MKKLIFLVLLFIPSIAFSAELERWALVVNNKIVKFKTVKASDNIIKPKLVAHGYLIVVKAVAPAHDEITQRLESGYTVEQTQVVRYYTVVEQPFMGAKEMKADKQKRIALDRIRILLGPNVTTAGIKPILDNLRDVLSLISSANNNTDLRGINDS